MGPRAGVITDSALACKANLRAYFYLDRVRIMGATKCQKR